MPLVVYYVLLQPYSIDVGLPVASLGIVVLAVQVTTVAASWLAHRVAGRFELTTIVTAGVVVLITATVILGAFPSIPSIAFMLAVALVPALVGPLMSARIHDLIPSEQRATILSLGALLFELGLAIAMPLLLVFADRLGAPVAIGISAGLVAVIVIPLLIMWRTAERRPVMAATTRPPLIG
jgi:predicted MFS family arabinose efflux permease